MGIPLGIQWGPPLGSHGHRAWHAEPPKCKEAWLQHQQSDSMKGLRSETETLSLCESKCCQRRTGKIVYRQNLKTITRFARTTLARLTRTSSLAGDSSLGNSRLNNHALNCENAMRQLRLRMLERFAEPSQKYV